MATLTAIKFATPEGAQQALGILQEEQKQQLLQIDDAATVSWPVGAKKPKTKQAINAAGIGALDGAFWGMLFGLIFFIPFLGAAIGAGMGALAGSLADVGINDSFIKQSRDQITEGTSALFLLSESAVVERVLDGLKDLPAHELIASNLSSEQEARLKEAFAHQ